MLLWLGISGVASGTMGPLLATIFLPKLATRPAAIASLLVGVGSYIVILMLDFGPSNLASGGYAVIVGLLTMIIVGFFTKERGQINHVG